MSLITDSAVEKDVLYYLQSDLAANYPIDWANSDNRVPLFLDYFLKLANTAKAGIHLGPQFFADNFVKYFSADYNLSAEFMNAFLRGVKAGRIPYAVSEPVAAARGVSIQSTTQQANAIAAAQAEKALEKETGGGLFGGITKSIEDIAGSWGNAAKMVPWILIVAGLGYAYITFGAAGKRVADRVR